MRLSLVVLALATCLLAPAELAVQAIAALEAGRESGDRIAQRVIRWGTLYDTCGDTKGQQMPASYSSFSFAVGGTSPLIRR